MAKVRKDHTYKNGDKEFKKDKSVPYNFVGEVVIPRGVRVVTDDKGEIVIHEVGGGLKRVFVHPDDIDTVIIRNS